MLRHIAWFNEAPVAPLPEGGLTSEDDAVRRRCLMPARAIEKEGVSCSVFGNLQDADPMHVSRHLQKLNADIVVIGEIAGPSRLKLARAAKHLGCYVIADVSARDDDDEAFAQLMQVADMAVAATPALAALVTQQTGADVSVIPDCDLDDLSARSASAVAKMWLDCFHKIKQRPPASANMNMPS